MDHASRSSILRQFIFEGAISTLSIPTLRLGRPLVISAVGFRQDDEGGSKNVEPSQWYSLDFPHGRILAIGRTEISSPVGSDWEVIGKKYIRAFLPLSVAEANACLEDSWGAVNEAFFGDQSMEFEQKERIARALRTMTPSSLHVWLHACCPDFWSWLDDVDGSS